MSTSKPPVPAVVLRPDTRHLLLWIGILLVATNLRAPVTAVAPMLTSIRHDLGLSTAAAGALTTLPLLAFGLLSPFGGRLARAFGLERALFGALVTIAIGIGLRSVGPAWSLYAGTWVIGAGIAVGNVLLPSLVKRDFADHVATATSAYAFTMGVAAGLCSAVAAPLSQALGWRLALAAFMALTVVALVAWLPQLRHSSKPVSGTAATSRGASVWRSALAWQVTTFLGLNSTIYYVAIGWLPTILVADGYTPGRAGSIHGLLQFATAAAAPGLWLAMKRVRDLRGLAAGSALLSAVALAGWVVAPGWAAAWAIVFGLGTGAGIILGLTFVGMRARNAGDAAALSGMAQFVGYLLAATGPLVVGALHDARGAWDLPLWLCAALAVIAAGAGLLAGRQRHIA